MKTSDYKNLDIWVKAMHLAQMIYSLTNNYPDEEKYGLVSQMRRCAISIPSNIAEGHARNTSKEFIHFLRITLGSNAELETQAILSFRLNLINQTTLDQILTETKHLSKMTISLINYLNNKNANNNNNNNNNSN